MKKTRLLQYTREVNRVPLEYRRGEADPVPIITSIDEHIVQISLSSVSHVDCLTDKWKTLTVRYNIGDDVYPGLRHPPAEC